MGKLVTIWNKEDIVFCDVRSGVDPNTVAHEYADILINHMPGNAYDVLVNAITERVMKLCATPGVDLTDRYFVSGHITEVIENLSR